MPRLFNSENALQNSLRSWFKIRGRYYHGGIAFAFHRISGFFLVGYFLFHMLAFPQSLRIGFKIAPLIVFIATFHALNGLRLALNEIGVGYSQRRVFVMLAALLSFITLGAFLLLSS